MRIALLVKLGQCPPHHPHSPHCVLSWDISGITYICDGVYILIHSFIPLFQVTSLQHKMTAIKNIQCHECRKREGRNKAVGNKYIEGRILNRLLYIFIYLYMRRGLYTYSLMHSFINAFIHSFIHSFKKGMPSILTIIELELEANRQTKSNLAKQSKSPHRMKITWSRETIWNF